MGNSKNKKTYVVNQTVIVIGVFIIILIIYCPALWVIADKYIFLEESEFIMYDNSMEPYLKEGDVVKYKKSKARLLDNDDMVVYKSKHSGLEVLKVGKLLAVPSSVLSVTTDVLSVDGNKKQLSQKAEKELTGVYELRDDCYIIDREDIILKKTLVESLPFLPTDNDDYVTTFLGLACTELKDIYTIVD